MTVDQRLEDGILFVTVSNPPVNALSKIERQGLIDAIKAAEAADVRAVVIAGENGTFIAGADIREFDGSPLPPHLPDVTNAIEACPRPVIAAIAGAALGGGLEIALACHWRIAVANARLGLPEVTLGIVPGAGGTQRLPRLIDPAIAARMIASGKPIGAAEALKLGLIDEMVEAATLNESAASLARKTGGDDPAPRRVSLLPATALADHKGTLDELALSVRRSARGAQAPVAALNLVETALTEPFEHGLRKERETFLRLRSGDEAAALRHIFFAERDAARPPADLAGVTAPTINHVGVIGAGTMGTGIATSLADGGLKVTIVELSQEALDRGLKRIDDGYQAAARKGITTSAQAEARTVAVTGSTDYAALGGCDLIIEAAFESMEVKRDIFARLDRIAKPGAVLATNTSYLDIEAIADSVSRPEAVVGMHYFSPANVMKLLEIVRARRTSPEALAAALAVAKRTRKVSVIAGVCNGFIGNRMLRAYTREAGLLLLEGATPEQVDTALTDFGMAMGPFAVADLSGIDIGYKARQAMPPGSFDPRAVMVHDALVEAGHLGQKTGSGFYVYMPQTRARSPNPIVAELIASARCRTGIAARTVEDSEIADRCMLALAAEGQQILDEGIAARSGDIDVVYINGYGFPRHKGGPMFAANSRLRWSVAVECAVRPC